MSNEWLIAIAASLVIVSQFVVFTAMTATANCSCRGATHPHAVE